MQAMRVIFSSWRYFSPAFLFATLNIIFGTWAIYIPKIIQKLGISEGELGFAVFFMALGTLCTIPFVPKIINAIKLGKATLIAVLGFCVVFMGPFLADTYVQLCVALFGVGIFSGLLDVTINTLVTEIEKRDGVHFMSVSHGFFSLGGMLGAGIGSLVLDFVQMPVYHAGVVVLVMLLINALLSRHYVHIDAVKEEREGSFKLRNLRPLIGLAVIGFLVMASEGAIVDWSALYLEKVTFASLALAGLGYTIFNGMMALGRFFGDSISARFGSRIILIAGCLTATLGFGLTLTAITFWALLGFGFVGIGLSLVVPELFRYSGKLKGIQAAEGISFIAGTGFVGLLIGPVFLGFLAETFNLKGSFIALMSFTAAAGILAMTLKRTK
ncbi:MULTISPECIES: MFS transporter [unclassified Leeuwenhoekiella]|uniref:MFS transporter n=1 Tax=unclassified Leeuwenhoekiella TaxID=2615029 RepID=UPI000C3DDEEF|nr:MULTISPECIES: MFS transporter [unclassified Leeuwenhoekiella]MAW96595.1 MFS transporter [Leeuwenhoekiella sp.]MBA81483.1 MFS transporter [Leeuwenhoekiella sp.]|tara:strand:+ start:10475 stop:11626 length:1152 start_codon:yes stop_codon:yes gene_type:complete